MVASLGTAGGFGGKEISTPEPELENSIARQSREGARPLDAAGAPVRRRGARGITAPAGFPPTVSSGVGIRAGCTSHLWRSHRDRAQRVKRISHSTADGEGATLQVHS